MEPSDGRSDHRANAIAKRQVLPPSPEAKLPAISLSHLILKHIVKLRTNDGAAQDHGTDDSSYYIRTTAALFLANVHYLLYACGMIHTHVGHLVKESAFEQANLPGLKQSRQQRNRKVLVDDLTALEHHVQRAVSSAHYSTHADTTIPMALVLGPSPISPRKVYYMEQRIRPRSTSQAQTQQDTLPAHSLLPTFTRSSLCLSLHRFLISHCPTDPMKRGAKVYLFIMQPVEWKCPGWHRRHGINIDLSSLAEAEDENAANVADATNKGNIASRGDTPASLLEEEETSRTPSPAPNAHGTPLRRPLNMRHLSQSGQSQDHPSSPMSTRPLNLRRTSHPHSSSPSCPMSNHSSDPRPPGSRLQMATSSSLKLRPSTANGAGKGTGTSFRLAKASKKKRINVVGFRMDSWGEQRQEEEQEKELQSTPLAWFQCETVISGCV